MKNESFYEILVKKMQEKQGASITPSAPTQIETSADSFVEKSKLETEILWARLFTEKIKPPSSSVTGFSVEKKYPSSMKRPGPIAAPESPASTTADPLARKNEKEKWVIKSSLDEDGISKWNLFEKTVSVSFGDKLNPRQARSAYRNFLKKIHPDQTGTPSNHNFATLVKIKDELISVLEKSLSAEQKK